MQASGEAQSLALVAKHFGVDPYRLWNMGGGQRMQLTAELEAGQEPVPQGSVSIPETHPRPRAYRVLLYALAWWVEENEAERHVQQLQASGVEVTFKRMMGGG